MGTDDITAAAVNAAVDAIARVLYEDTRRNFPEFPAWPGADPDDRLLFLIEAFAVAKEMARLGMLNIPGSAAS